MPPESFEFLVVGGGKGGKTLAMTLARQGKRVAMVERGLIGGGCINLACIPTKTMVRSAEVAHLARRAAEFGIAATPGPIAMAAVRRRKREVVAGAVARNLAAFERSGLELVMGTARFTGPRAVEVALDGGGTRTLSGERVVVNTGTRPALPELPGLAAAGPLTSESAQELDRLPDHLLILGGGTIGVEFAQLFARLGSRVTLVDRGAAFLPREEPDIGAALLEVLRGEGIDVKLGAAVAGVAGRSGDSVRLDLTTGAGAASVEGSHLMVALGRVPNTEALNLGAAGIELDSRGYVRVNDRLEASAPGTYAVGDSAGSPQYTHAALDDAHVVLANLAGGNRSTSGRLMPYTIFTDPELGRVGPTEAEARKAGRAVRVATLPASAIPRAVTSGETRGLLKAVIDADTDRILGASILCHGGGEVMAAVQVAMLGGLTAAQLRDAVFAHPTMTEGLGELFAR